MASDGQGGHPWPDDAAELAKDPEAMKVREWRYQLQKVFLTAKDRAPKEKYMSEMDDLFTQIETYDKMTVIYLQFSKIGKVIRLISALSDDKVTLDSQYRFRERAKKLVERWQHITDASRAGVNGKKETLTEAPVTMKNANNGHTPNEVGSEASTGEEASQSSGAKNGATGHHQQDASATTPIKTQNVDACEFPDITPLRLSE